MDFLSIKVSLFDIKSTLSFGNDIISSGSSTIELSSRFRTLSLKRSAIAGSMDTILFCERFRTSIALIVNTSLGMKPNYLLERSNSLLLLLFACLKKTVSSVIFYYSLSGVRFFLILVNLYLFLKVYKF